MVKESRSFTTPSIQKGHRGLVGRPTKGRHNRRVEHADRLGHRRRQLNQVRVSCNPKHVRQGYQSQSESRPVRHEFRVTLNRMLGRTVRKELVNQGLQLVHR